MALFGIRFDFRNPGFAGTTTAERYRAGLEMAEWADRTGFLLVVLSEHHGSDDGYLPSALTMAAAVAARTERVRILISALVTSFHDPLRLAEEVAVVDNISGGRLDLVLTGGYVPEEFAMFGAALGERGRRTTEAVEFLRQAATGEPFEYASRTVRVTPPPAQQPLRITLGGSSPAAARRAAQIADGFMPSTGEVWADYRAECLRLGKPDPGADFAGGDTHVVHLATDPDAEWERITPFAMHEANAYARWMRDGGVGDAGGYRGFDDPAALRASDQYRVRTPAELVDELTAAGPWAFAMFHPMFGGLPPELAWRSLRLLEEEVLPRL